MKATNNLKPNYSLFQGEFFIFIHKTWVLDLYYRLTVSVQIFESYLGGKKLPGSLTENCVSGFLSMLISQIVFDKRML